MSHLTPAQLTAARDGELHDAPAARHLTECAKCQAGLAEAKRLASLLRSASSEPAREHPSDLTLAAYIEKTLSGREQCRTAEHIASCPRCSAMLEAVRSALAEIE